MRTFLVLMVSIPIIFGHCGNFEGRDIDVSVTQEEIDLMARVVMSESSTEPFECKQGIASVILNRLKAGNYGSDIFEVVNAEGQFSTADNGTPTAECYEAVQAALDYQDGFPSDMLYFRASHYHNFANPYCHIGNTYFSTKTNYMEEME